MTDSLTNGNGNLISTVKSTQTAVETGGVSGLPGAPSPVGNATTWSRLSATVALANGSITQGQYNSVMKALEVYKQTQVDNARDPVRGTSLSNS
jgi:hypothetical protein